jgi:predicted PurR-regulated permease PerM
MTKRAQVGEGSLTDGQFVRRAFLVALVAGLFAVLWALSEILLLIFAAVLLAVVLRAIADRLSFHTHASQRWSLLIAAAVLFGLLAVAVFLFGSHLSAQFQQLVTQLHAVQDTLTGYIGSEPIKNLLGSGSVGALFVRVLSWGTTAMTAVAGLVLVIIAGIYMAITPAVYREGFIKLFPIEWHDRIGATLDDCASALRLWLGAQMAAMAIVGALIGVGALLLGIPSSLALGLIFGLSEFVPVVGPIVGAVPVLIVALGQGWELALWALALVIVIQQLESNVIIPLIAGHAVRLPPAVGLFSVIAMGVLFGPLGLVVGYPLAVVCDVAVRRLYVREALGEEVEIVAEKSRSEQTIHN